MDQKSPEAFRTISEVAEWLGVPTHVLRFWESRFSQVKPVKRAGGRRYYRPADMELLGGIRKLLHEDGMTIRGVQKLLREKGVRHVAEMSPPLDLSADARDVTPDNVVDLSDRREAEATTTEPEDDAGETADEEDAPWYDSGIFAEAPAAATGAGPDREADAEQPGAPEPESPAAPEAVDPEPVAPAETSGTEAPRAVDIADPLPDPATMDFLAHDATPEVFETEDDRAGLPPSGDTALETDPADPMSSPDALAFAAHDAEPETHEPGAGAPGEAPQAPTAALPPEPAPSETDGTQATGADEPDVAGQPVADTDQPAQTDAPDTPGATEVPETAPPPPEPEPEPAPRPALVMPEIGPDPEDDALVPDALPVAARLRAARASRAGLPAASLRALADRLDEIARQMRASGF